MQALRQRLARLLAASPIVAAACIGDPTAVQQQVLECADPQVDSSGWQAGTGVTFDYKVPPYYTWVPEANRWEYGESWIKPQVLMAGQFPSDPSVTLTRYSECRAEIGSVPDVFVQLGLTGPDAPWGIGWYSSATFEDVAIDPEGMLGTLLIESWTNEVQDEVDHQIGVYWNVVFRPLEN
jgi:hypothetical protein